jgi:16S rRNA (cytosine967-C5)-methyltransferase
VRKILCVAGHVIQDVLSGRSLTQALAVHRAKANFDISENAAVQDISYGVLRHYGVLRSISNKLLDKPLQEPILDAVLLAALYQLQYSKAPAYAVVDQAVSATIALRKNWAKGLFNATLRNFLRQREKLISAANKSELGKYSYQSWWIAKVRQQYPAEYEDVLSFGNNRPIMALRVNRNHSTNEAYLKLLNTHDIEAAIVGSGIILNRPLPVEKLPQFTAGWVSVQDLSAQYAATLLDAHNGMRVLDACAAPGGKTGHLLELADLDLTALEQDSERVKQVASNLERLNLKAKVICANVISLDDWWDGKPYQRVLADVPCSASGVVSRHPDIKWLRREADIIQFAKQQRAILEALWQVLDKSGKLLYCTCSIFTEENRQQIIDFLKDHSDAKEIPLAIADVKDGQLLPTAQHNGFFYALLQKA